MPSTSREVCASASSEPSKDPVDVLAEAEQQWIYSEEELLRSPSILAGMKPEEERQLQVKGINFIAQVGIMLKLPQTTISTAAVFFHRFLMRQSLVHNDHYRALHHYQIAAISLFLATKVEEHSRKLKDIVVACCRVAQKNPNLLVDEQTKDYWRWRDTILLNEDVLLEQLCFDLTIDSPYKILYELLRLYNVHRHHKLRDAAWAFLNDQNMTQLCLLFPSRTIACAALYCAAKHCDISFPDDSRGQAWWDVQNVKGEDLVKAYNYMAALYETPNTPLKSNFGGENIYAGGLTPLDGNGSFEKTRRRIQRGSSEDDPLGRSTGSSGCERVKRKRSNSVERENGRQNGHASKGSDTEGADQRRVKRARSEEAQGSPTAESKPAENGGSTAHLKSDDASEEGEVEE